MTDEEFAIWVEEMKKKAEKLENKKKEKFELDKWKMKQKINHKIIVRGKAKMTDEESAIWREQIKKKADNLGSKEKLKKIIRLEKHRVDKQIVKKNNYKGSKKRKSVKYKHLLNKVKYKSEVFKRMSEVLNEK